MRKECEVCGEDFEAERSTARFCTPGCRKLAFQRGRVSVPGDSVPGLSVIGGGVTPVTVPGVTGVIDPSDPAVIAKVRRAAEGVVPLSVVAASRKIEKKVREMLPDGCPSVSGDVPCNTGTFKLKQGEVFLDLEKGLKLDLRKDLGVYYWTPDGIFIRPDITVDQVQNIARIIHAKHDRPCPKFFEDRK
jgi:hypothetical protein